jgi:very-short-patch-repair endonuclease
MYSPRLRASAPPRETSFPFRTNSVGAFVIDCCSPALKLGIELDGDSHCQPAAREYDQERQRFIESFGIRILRIWNSEIYDNLDGVLEMIGMEVLKRKEQGKALRPKNVDQPP